MHVTSVKALYENSVTITNSLFSIFSNYWNKCSHNIVIQTEWSIFHIFWKVCYNIHVDLLLFTRAEKENIDLSYYLNHNFARWILLHQIVNDLYSKGVSVSQVQISVLRGFTHIYCSDISALLAHVTLMEASGSLRII